MTYALSTWLLQRYAEQQVNRKKQQEFREMLNTAKIDDFGIRRKGDHYESYHIKSGKSLYEAFTYEEARRDLLEEFGEI